MLTTYLMSCSSKSYTTATQHPFLKAARDQSLSKERLSFWLAQDRIYAAHAYPRFIGALIAKIPFSSHHRLESNEEVKNKRLLVALSGALHNVAREVDFFLESNRKYNLNIDIWEERKETRSYCAEMARIANTCSLEEGLVFLWAMEKIYLDSWTYVASGLPTSTIEERDSAVRAIGDFANNWSNNDFVNFVADLQTIVDDLPIQGGSDLWLRVENIWKRTIELEIDFWPGENEKTQENYRRKQSSH